MSNDFDKAHLLSQFKQNFSVDPETMNRFLNQISNPEIRNNFPRIDKGLRIEGNFEYLFRTLPWVKNLHGLEQRQEEKSKKDYQVPDFSLMIEDSNNSRFPLLIEVKSVKKEKENFEIQPKQKNTLKNYARDEKKDLLLAIFWEKFLYWTCIVPNSLGGKNKKKISFKEALSNDLSHILSDYNFVVDRKFYRKIKFKQCINKEKDVLKNYIHIDKIEISTDENKFIEITKEHSLAIDSLAVDSTLKMKKVSYDDTSFTLVEELGSPIFIKLSTWMIRYSQVLKRIQQFDERNNSDILDKNERNIPNWEVVRTVIIDFLHTLDISPFYPLPKYRDESVDSLWRKAYGGTYVEKDYFKLRFKK